MISVLRIFWPLRSIHIYQRQRVFGVFPSTAVSGNIQSPHVHPQCWAVFRVVMVTRSVRLYSESSWSPAVSGSIQSCHGHPHCQVVFSVVMVTHGVRQCSESAWSPAVSGCIRRRHGHPQCQAVFRVLPFTAVLASMGHSNSNCYRCPWEGVGRLYFPCVSSSSSSKWFIQLNIITGGTNNKINKRKQFQKYINIIQQFITR